MGIILIVSKSGQLKCFFLLALCLMAVTASAVISRPAYFYKIVTSETQGFVFWSDGKTPAIGVPVRLWDIEKREFVFETATDENGAFRLPALGPGRYFVTFDTIRLDLEVLPQIPYAQQQAHDIIVVIPRGVASVPLTQLQAILLAGTISEGALLYRNEDRKTIVSP